MNRVPLLLTVALGAAACARAGDGAPAGASDDSAADTSSTGGSRELGVEDAWSHVVGSPERSLCNPMVIDGVDGPALVAGGAVYAFPERGEHEVGGPLATVPLGVGVGWDVSVGDLDGDDLGDVVVEEATLSVDGDVALEGGTARVYLGPLAGDLSASDAALSWTSPTCEGCRFAAEISPDLDGDARADLLLSAESEDDQRWISVLSLSGTKTDLVQSGTGHGFGDLDGDGLADLVVDEGDAVYWFAGPVAAGTGLADAAAVLRPPSGDATLSCSAAGDVDADGTRELVCTGAASPTDPHGYILGGPPTTGEAPVATFAYRDHSTRNDVLWARLLDADADGDADLVATDPVGPDPDGRGEVAVVLAPFAGAIELDDADVRWVGEPGDALGYGPASLADVADGPLLVVGATDGGIVGGGGIYLLGMP